MASSHNLKAGISLWFIDSTYNTLQTHITNMEQQIVLCICTVVYTYSIDNMFCIVITSLVNADTALLTLD